MRTHWRIRTHLLLLVLAAALPLSGLLLVTTLTDIAQNTQQASAETLRLAHLTAHRIEQSLNNAATLAALVNRQPLIRAGRITTCAPILTDIHDLYPYFTNVAIFDPAGNVVCSVVNLPESKTISVASLPWFQHVIRTGEPAIGSVEIGPITGHLAVVLGYPLHDVQGQVVGALALPLDLARFNPTFSDVELPDGSAVTVVDAEGAVIARSPDPDRWVGKNVSSTELLGSPPSQREGTVWGNGVDRVERLYAYTDVQGMQWHVYIGIPTHVVFAAVWANLSLNLVLGLSTCCIVLLLILAVSRGITRQIGTIADAARAVSQGQLDTRLPLAGPVELVQVAQALNTMLDVRTTEEQALRENRHFIARVTYAIPDALYIFDIVDQHIVYVNNGVANQLGYAAAAVTAMGAHLMPGLLHPQDLPRCEAHITRLKTMQEGEVYELEYRMRHADGGWRWFYSRDTVFLRDGNGDPCQIIGTARDVTERIAMEHALRESENKFRSLVEQSLDGIVLVDAHGTIIEWNRGQERNTGIKRSEAVGRLLWDIQFLLTPDNTKAPAHYEQIKSTVLAILDFQHTTWTHHPTEREIQHTDGSRRILQSVLFPIHTDQGIIIGSISRDITDHKRAEGSRALLASIVESSNDAIISRTVDGTILSWNPGATRMYGYTAAEAIGQSIAILFPPDVVDHPQAAVLNGTGAGDSVEHVETERRRKDGSPVHISLTVSLLRDSGGQMIGTASIARDITRRQQAEKALRDSEALFHDVADSAPGLIWLVDANNRCTYVSKRWSEFTGQTLDEARGIGWTACIPQGEREKVWAAYESAFNTRQSFQMVYHFRRADGAYRWVIDSGVPRYSPDGTTFLGYIGSMMDITERKEAEEAQRKSEAAEREQRQLAEALRDSAAALANTLEPETVLVRILENAGRVVPHDAANIVLLEDGLARIAYWQGYWPESAPFFKGRPVAPDVVPDLKPLLQPGVRYYIGSLSTPPNKPNAFDPSLSWIQSHLGAPIRAHGRLIGFIHLDSATPDFFTTHHGEQLGIFADQAAIAIENAQLYDQLRQKALELERRVDERTIELHRAKDHVEAILNNSSDAIIVAHMDGCIRQTNPAFNHAFNYLPDEVIGQPVNILPAPVDSAVLLVALDAAVTRGEAQRVELLARRSDGQTFNADIALAPIIEQTQQVTGVVCSIRDISSHKRLEHELRRAIEHERELNELKSRFVTMVSHEFRTPLATIQTSSDLLGRYGERLSAEQKLERVQLIQAQVRHMTKLLEDALMIGIAEAGQLTFSPVPHSPEIFFREIIDLMQVSAESHRFVFTSDGRCVTFLIDRELLQHAIINLLSNAVMYSPAGTTIYCDLACEVDRVIFRVRDEGIGIPTEDLPHIFDVFRRGTNSGQVSGTGLGLAIVRQVIGLHHGSITVQSEAGHGATFTVCLPTNAESAPFYPQAQTASTL
ncbi:MAG: PAS domain S-box protein [Anaerolineae bacterium]|nr:PAS domain S-box protein [Anaerolineae bacterium]